MFFYMFFRVPLDSIFGEAILSPRDAASAFSRPSFDLSLGQPVFSGRFILPAGRVLHFSGKLVEDFGMFFHLSQVNVKDPGPLAAYNDRAGPLVLIQERGQRPGIRMRIDDQAGAEGNRKGEGPPESLSRAGKNQDASMMISVELIAKIALHLREIFIDRLPCFPIDR